MVNHSRCKWTSSTPCQLCKLSKPSRHQLKFGGVHGERGVRAYNGVLGVQYQAHFLSIIYINDLPESLNSDSSIYLYVDDAKIYRYLSTIKDRLFLHDDIEKLINWSEKCQIKVNICKCKVVSYGRNIDYN